MDGGDNDYGEDDDNDEDNNGVDRYGDEADHYWYICGCCVIEKL